MSTIVVPPGSPDEIESSRPAASIAPLTIVCGITHLEPRAEELAQAWREAEGYRTDGGCGKRFELTDPLHLTTVYRCVECGRWMCKACILAHFEQSKHDQLAGQQSILPEITTGDWIQVFSGGRFYPLSPRVEDVHIEDIAHALSNICRYTGHTSRFYSVAEHALILSKAVKQRDPTNHAEQLQALMHDAAEAYICDLPRPVKPRIPGYKDIEGRIEVVIQEAFGLLAPGKTPLVDELDALVLYDEARALMPFESVEWHKQFAPGLGIPVKGLPPEVVEQEFLDRFFMLRQKLFEASMCEGAVGGASC